VAGAFRDGNAQWAVRVLTGSDNLPRMLRLVAEELEGKRTKSETKKRFNILRAYLAVCERYIRNGDRRAPTLHEVKLEYAHAKSFQRALDQSERKWLAELEAQNKIPRTRWFKETLVHCRCELRKDQRGAPRK